MVGSIVGDDILLPWPLFIKVLCESSLPTLQVYHLPGFILGITQRTSLLAQTVKNPPVIQGTRIWSLSWEDPLEMEMATHSSILVQNSMDRTWQATVHGVAKHHTHTH